MKNNLIAFKKWMDENNIRYTVDDKGNIIDVIDIEKRDVYCRTPLMLSALYNMVEIAQLLIDKGVNINAKNSSNENSLYYATINNSKEVIRLLISKGIDINIKFNRYY